MDASAQAQFIRVLQEEIALPATEVAAIQRLLNRLIQQHPDFTQNLLPVILWQYGLLSLEQLDKLLSWFGS